MELTNCRSGYRFKKWARVIALLDTIFSVMMIFGIVLTLHMYFSSPSKREYVLSKTNLGKYIVPCLIGTIVNLILQIVSSVLLLVSTSSRISLLKAIRLSLIWVVVASVFLVVSTTFAVISLAVLVMVQVVVRIVAIFIVSRYRMELHYWQSIRLKYIRDHAADILHLHT